MRTILSFLESIVSNDQVLAGVLTVVAACVLCDTPYSPGPDPVQMADKGSGTDKDRGVRPATGDRSGDSGKGKSADIQPAKESKDTKTGK